MTEPHAVRPLLGALGAEHRSASELGSYNAFVQTDGGWLKERLTSLVSVLDGLRAAGKI